MLKKMQLSSLHAHRFTDFSNGGKTYVSCLKELLDFTGAADDSGPDICNM